MGADEPGGIAYVVTSGCYSMYGIEAVYGSRADAEQHMACRGEPSRWEPAQIEEWPIGGRVRGDGRAPWHVRYEDHGPMESADFRWRAERTGCVNEKPQVFHQWRNPLRPLSFTADVWAHDEQHALKIGSELLAAAKAEHDLTGCEVCRPVPAGAAE